MGIPKCIPMNSSSHAVHTETSICTTVPHPCIQGATNALQSYKGMREMRPVHLSYPKPSPYCHVNALSPEPLAEGRGTGGHLFSSFFYPSH